MTDTMDNQVIASRPAARLLAGNAGADPQQHVAIYGEFAPAQVARSLFAELDSSGLTGRGGAAFPSARKISALLDAGGRSNAVVIGNGSEGEPRSLKDVTLLSIAPHVVIDGLLALGAAIGTRRLFLHVHPDAMVTVVRAVRSRRETRRITVVEAADTFISGEASAVVNAIAGRAAIPVDRSERLTTVGLQRRPTAVFNVETLAHIALIARYGAAWFRSMGSAGDPGTRLVTVSGAVTTETVLEVPGGARLSDILARCEPDLSRIQAVLVGGYHGRWVGPEYFGDRLGAVRAGDGLAAGAGILYVLGRHECGIRTTAQIIDYLASQSAEQCGPCRFGLPALASEFAHLAYDAAPAARIERVLDLARSVAGRGACHHPDGTARLVTSAIHAFTDDIEAHRRGGCVSHTPVWGSTR